MKKILLSLSILLLLTTAAMAQSPVWSVMGANPITAKITVADASQLLSTAFDAAYGGTDPTWTKVNSVLITCEDNDVRISFGTAAGQGASAMGHILYVGQSLRIPSGDMLRKAYIINKTNGSAGTIIVTVER